MDGNGLKASIMAFNSVLNIFSEDSVLFLSIGSSEGLVIHLSVLKFMSPLGMSCQTSIPTLSQYRYQTAGSTFVCLRIILNPISLVFTISKSKASAVGAV